jgi:hypothetical protein
LTALEGVQFCRVSRKEASWNSRMGNMIPLLIGILLVIPGVSSNSQAAHPLSDVHRIYVGSMGQDDEAVRFRGLLKQELTQLGFTIEDDSAKADAVLSGTLSVRVLAGYSRAYADVVLQASDGATIWQGSFDATFLRGRKGNDDVKNCSGNIADKLLKDFQQSTAHR